MITYPCRAGLSSDPVPVGFERVWSPRPPPSPQRRSHSPSAEEIPACQLDTGWDSCVAERTEQVFTANQKRILIQIQLICVEGKGCICTVLYCNVPE